MPATMWPLPSGPDEDGNTLWTFFGVPAGPRANLIPIMASSERAAVDKARNGGHDLTPGTIRFRGIDWSGYQLPTGAFYILRRCASEEEMSAALAEVPSVAAAMNTLQQREPLRSGPFWMFLQVPICRGSKMQASRRTKVEDALADLHQRCQLRLAEATVGLVDGREVQGFLDQKRRSWVGHYIRNEAEGEAFIGSIPDALQVLGLHRTF